MNHALLAENIAYIYFLKKYGSLRANEYRRGHTIEFISKEVGKAFVFDFISEGIVYRFKCKNGKVRVDKPRGIA